MRVKVIDGEGEMQVGVKNQKEGRIAYALIG